MVVEHQYSVRGANFSVPYYTFTNKKNDSVMYSRAGQMSNYRPSPNYQTSTLSSVGRGSSNLLFRSNPFNILKWILAIILMIAIYRTGIFKWLLATKSSDDSDDSDDVKEKNDKKKLEDAINKATITAADAESIATFINENLYGFSTNQAAVVQKISSLHSNDLDLLYIIYGQRIPDVEFLPYWYEWSTSEKKSLFTAFDEGLDAFHKQEMKDIYKRKSTKYKY